MTAWAEQRANVGSKIRSHITNLVFNRMGTAVDLVLRIMISPCDNLKHLGARILLSGVSRIRSNPHNPNEVPRLRLCCQL